MNTIIGSLMKTKGMITNGSFTFNHTNTFNERNALMERVYPKLKSYCQSVGYDFQVVDMRWGIRDEATDDHMTTELCMKELKACQDLSTGPNFITFLGQKYGYRPFPSMIAATEFEELLNVVNLDSEKDLLLKWFRKDENLVPPKYVLQPIRDILPDYRNFTKTQMERNAAKTAWWSEFEQLQVILRQSARKTLVEESEIEKYIISVTEDEIKHGILNAPEADKHCFWFRRVISDISQHLGEEYSKNFIDKIWLKGLDEEATCLLENLRSQKICRTLPSDNIKTYEVQWSGRKCIDPKNDDSHKQYITELCEDFYNILKGMISQAIKEKEKILIEDDLCKEIIQQASIRKQKSKLISGRDDVLQQMLDYVEGEQASPLVLYGKSGCGKTSIMAAAINMVKQKHPKVAVIQRFLGTTRDSSTLRNTLHSLCSQLCVVSGQSKESVPKDFNSLVDFFAKQLQNMEEKLVIFLDSLDQLSRRGQGQTVGWIPRKLPGNVKIIISSLPGEEFNILPSLKRVLPPESFIEVPELGSSSARTILQSWLDDAKHTLTDEQQNLVLGIFKSNPLPLLLKLSFDESLTWRSYTPFEQITLCATVKTAINNFFDRLETKHGTIFVSRILGYMTASKYGLSDAEIDDLASIDDDILNDVYQYWTPPVRRIPPLLWLRLKADLGSYIVSKGADGVLVNNWYHRQFYQAAKERYLPLEKATQVYHVLAEYFLGTWADGKAKPVKGKPDFKEDRLAPSMPNIFKTGKVFEDDVFNLRKLNELPYLLVKLGDVALLKSTMACNFDFLLAKLRGCGIQNVFEEFQKFHQAFPGDEEIRIIYKVLGMGHVTLLEDPFQLAAQFVGRLGESCETFFGIKSLIKQAKETSIPCLYPSINVLDDPGSIVQKIPIQDEGVDALCMSKGDARLVSFSNSTNMVRIWDTCSGNQIGSIHLDDHPPSPTTVGSSAHSMLLYHNDECLVQLSSWRNNPEQNYFGAFDLDTEEKVMESKAGEFVAYSMTLTADETRLILYGDSVDILDVSEKKPVHLKTLKIDKELKDSRIVASNEYIACSQTFNEITVFKLNDDSFEKTLTLKEIEPTDEAVSQTNLIGFEFNPSGAELVALLVESKPAEKDDDSLFGDDDTCDWYDELVESYSPNRFRLVIWDTVNWNCLKILEEADTPGENELLKDESSDIHVIGTPSGSEVIWPAFQGQHIAFWKIENENLQFSSRKVACSQIIVKTGNLLATVPLTSAMGNRGFNIEVHEMRDLGFVSERGQLCGSKPKQFPGNWDKKKIHLNPVDPDTILVEGEWPGKHSLWSISQQNLLIEWDSGNEDLLIPVTESTLFSYKCGPPGFHLVSYPNIQKGPSFQDYCFEDFIKNWAHLEDLKFIIRSRDCKALNIWNLQDDGSIVESHRVTDNEVIKSLWLSKDKTAVVIIVENEKGEKQFKTLNLKSPSPDEFQSLQTEEDVSEVGAAVFSDGLLCFYKNKKGSNIQVFDVKSGEKIASLTIDCQDFEIFGYVVSHKNGYLLAHCKHKDKYGVWKLVTFSTSTWQIVAEYDCPLFEHLFLSEDGIKVLTYEELSPMKIILYDVSQVLQGRLSLIGQFIDDAKQDGSDYFTRAFAERTLGPCAMSLDGHAICSGMKNADGIVFFKPCGTSGDNDGWKTDQEYRKVFSNTYAIQT